MSSKKPVYLLAGGRPRNEQTLNSLLHEVYRESGVKSPTIAYVGVANNDSKPFYLMMTTSLKSAGAGKIKHSVISPKKADLKKAQDILESADIIYISGGDVEHGMQILKEKNMVEILVELYNRGKLFLGISAGSIMLAIEWVLWTDPNNDASAEVFPCLGIAPILCDTHGEQDGWEELQSLLILEKDGTIGYGIPSGAAIKVLPDGTIEALGGATHQYIKQNGNVKRITDISPIRSL
ncbi:hypothetical protein FJY84_09270 [Candidatus Bathyarchaeota archaeon]|nr:hypothetical protein [Candidatus Bathyarchaeota archaeon]